MTSPTTLSPRSHKRLFWLGVAVCTALGMQAQALASVDTPYSSPYSGMPGPDMANSATSSGWSETRPDQALPAPMPADSTYAEWHGYAPHRTSSYPYETTGWPAPTENADSAWNSAEQQAPQSTPPAPGWSNHEAAMPTATFNEVADWVPPPPG
jgi:protein transport protein SEC31